MTVWDTTRWHLATVSDTERDSRRRDNSTLRPARPRSSGTPCGTTSDTCRTAAAGRRPCRWRSRTSGPTAGTRGGGTRHASASTLATHVANTSRPGRRAVGLRINEIDGFIRQFIIEGGLPVYRGWSTTPLSPHPSPLPRCPLTSLPSPPITCHCCLSPGSAAAAASGRDRRFAPPLFAALLAVFAVARCWRRSRRSFFCLSSCFMIFSKSRSDISCACPHNAWLTAERIRADSCQSDVRHQPLLSTQRLIDSRADYKLLTDSCQSDASTKYLWPNCGWSLCLRFY